MPKKTRKVARKAPIGRAHRKTRATRPAARKKAAKERGAAPGYGKRLADLCRSLPGTTEDIKWGDDLVFSVGGKMYAAFDLDEGDELGFKCTEDVQMRLIQRHGVIPAPYAAKYGWVKVQARGGKDGRCGLGEQEMAGLVRASYELVLSCLPKRTQGQIRGVSNAG